MTYVLQAARRATELRRCTGCGRPLEAPGRELDVDAYVGCVHCGRLYQVAEHGLERVFLGLVPRELRQAFEELLEDWWQSRINAVARAAA